MRPHIEGLRARGSTATAIDLPQGQAERAIPVFAHGSPRCGPRSSAATRMAAGSRACSRRPATPAFVAGLVLLSYPLHRPGHPDDQRTEHWPGIHCPVLLLSGDADPFARMALLREAVASFAGAALVVYAARRPWPPPVLGDALDQVAAFVQPCSRQRRGEQ